MPAMKFTNANLGESILHFHRRTIRIMCTESPCSLISPAASSFQVSVITEFLPVSPQHDSLDSALTQDSPCSLLFSPNPIISISQTLQCYSRNPWFLVWVYTGIFFNVCISFISSVENGDRNTLTSCPEDSA